MKASKSINMCGKLNEVSVFNYILKIIRPVYGQNDHRKLISLIRQYSCFFFYNMMLRLYTVRVI